VAVIVARGYNAPFCRRPTGFSEPLLAEDISLLLPRLYASTVSTPFARVSRVSIFVPCDMRITPFDVSTDVSNANSDVPLCLRSSLHALCSLLLLERGGTPPTFLSSKDSEPVDTSKDFPHWTRSIALTWSWFSPSRSSCADVYY